MRRSIEEAIREIVEDGVDRGWTWPTITDEVREYFQATEEAFMAWDAEQPPTPRPSDAELAAWAEIDDAAPLVNGRPFDSKWIFQATNRLANVTRSQPLTLWRARPAFHPQGGGTRDGGPNPLFPSRAAPFSQPHPARNRSTWPTCAATASPIGCASVTARSATGRTWATVVSAPRSPSTVNSNPFGGARMQASGEEVYARARGLTLSCTGDAKAAPCHPPLLWAFGRVHPERGD